MGGADPCVDDPECHEPSDPLFVFGIVGGDGTSDGHYPVYLTDRLDTDLDFEDAPFATEARNHVVGLAGEGIFFVVDADGFVTRYELDTNGRPRTMQAPVEFVNPGEYGALFHFVSQKKAYFMGSTALLVWDPVAMSVTSQTSFTDEVMLRTDVEGRSCTPTSSQLAPVQVGDELFWGRGWYCGFQMYPETQVAVIDTKTDDLEFVSDERCPYAREGVLGADGFIYFATEAFGVAAHVVYESDSRAPCMVRFDPDTREFDPDFVVSTPGGMEALLAAGLEAPLLSGPIFRSPGGKFFMKVIDMALVNELPSVPSTRFLASAAYPVFRWVSVTLDDEPQVELLDLPPTSGSMLGVSLNGRAFAIQPLLEASAQFTNTNFWEITDTGPSLAFVVPGQSHSALQVR